MSALRVTVVIPCHNAAGYLAQALRCVRAQQYQPLEIWVVDDGSVDGTEEFVRQYGGLHYLRQECRGPAAARNLALRELQSDVVAFLDADDLWAHDHLRRLTEILVREPETAIAQGKARNWREEPGSVPSYCSAPYQFSLLCSAVFRRSVFERVGLLDETLRFGEDTDFFIRCWEHDLRKTKGEAVSLFYRRHAGNMTAGKDLRGLGIVQIHKRRRDRIRQGLMDVDASRSEGLREYLGAPPDSFDDGRQEPVGEEILGYLTCNESR